MSASYFRAIFINYFLFLVILRGIFSLAIIFVSVTVARVTIARVTVACVTVARVAATCTVARVAIAVAVAVVVVRVADEVINVIKVKVPKVRQPVFVGDRPNTGDNLFLTEGMSTGIDRQVKN